MAAKLALDDCGRVPDVSHAHDNIYTLHDLHICLCVDRSVTSKLLQRAISSLHERNSLYS